jgi:hypothetical protein
MFTKLDTLLHEVNVNDDTDYWQLYTMIELMNVVVGSERLQPQEKVCENLLKAKLQIVVYLAIYSSCYWCMHS